MKYKIINSDIFLAGKLIPEGNEIELTTEQIIGLESFLIPIESERHTVQSRSISEVSSNNAKQKTKGNKK